VGNDHIYCFTFFYFVVSTCKLAPKQKRIRLYFGLFFVWYVDKTQGENHIDQEKSAATHRDTILMIAEIEGGLHLAIHTANATAMTGAANHNMRGANATMIAEMHAITIAESLVTMTVENHLTTQSGKEDLLLATPDAIRLLQDGSMKDASMTDAPRDTIECKYKLTNSDFQTAQK